MRSTTIRHLCGAPVCNMVWMVGIEHQGLHLKVITSFIITFIKSIPKLIKGIYHLRNAILFSRNSVGPRVI